MKTWVCQSCIPASNPNFQRPHPLAFITAPSCWSCLWCTPAGTLSSTPTLPTWHSSLFPELLELPSVLPTLGSSDSMLSPARSLNGTGVPQGVGHVNKVRTHVTSCNHATGVGCSENCMLGASPSQSEWQNGCNSVNNGSRAHMWQFIYRTRALPLLIIIVLNPPPPPQYRIIFPAYK